MSKDPAFLFYSQDFIVGVQTMNFEDRGKYITILAQMHQQGRLDEETIRFMVGNVSDKLRLKFDVDKNGMWFNKRLEEEIDKRKNFIDSRRLNGQKGGRPKASDKPNGKPSVKPLGKAKNNLLEDENVNEIINKISYKKELYQYFDYLINEHNRSIGHMQVEQTLKMLDEWYNTDIQKKYCLQSNIANGWKTINFVEYKKSKSNLTAPLP